MTSAEFRAYSSAKSVRYGAGRLNIPRIPTNEAFERYHIYCSMAVQVRV